MTPDTKAILKSPLFYLGFALTTITTLQGCQPQTIGNRPGDDINPVMSARQKSIIAQHKNRDIN